MLLLNIGILIHQKMKTDNMKVYIIIAQTYCASENCWFDVYYDCQLDKAEAYAIALEQANKYNSEDVKYKVEEVTL